MSRHFVIYSVPPKRLKAELGSCNAVLKIEMKLGKDRQSKAVLALIDGARLNFDAPTLIHGFERLCSHLGQQLPNGNISPAPYSYMDEVDNAITQREFPLLLSTLMMAGAPVQLPASDDFPCVGHASADDVKSAASWLKTNALVADNDPVLDGALYDISEWVEFASSRGDMLIGFCY
jgi:hypothetical protein